ncbi:WD40 repeat-like protein [Fistulina hepatica ATCC 64428]|nr:WD40 repeat-like protein [Fistulina hepatica ATCC 64428]
MVHSTSRSNLPCICIERTIQNKLKPARVFKNAVEPPPTQASYAGYGSPRPNHGPRHITSMSIDDRGETLITAAEDETHTKVFYSKKYGVDLPRFTHKNTTVIHASTKEDDTIRYHSLHDNRYLQYFRGHTDKVISLEVSPIDDGFMSASIDKTVRLWDLRTPNCRGLLPLPAQSVVAYDTTGMVFAVAINNFAKILLYDQANFDKAPFLTISVEDPTLAFISYPPRPICMTSLSFSSNGKYILVGCSGNAHYIVDAFEGHMLAKLEGHTGLERRTMNMQPNIQPVRGCSGEEVSWTPDSNYVISGSLDGKIYIWDTRNVPTKSGEVDLQSHPAVFRPLAVLEGHPGISRCVKFNPKYLMLASAGVELAFWLPDPAPDGEAMARDVLRKM